MAIALSPAMAMTQRVDPGCPVELFRPNLGDRFHQNLGLHQSSSANTEASTSKEEDFFLATLACNVPRKKHRCELGSYNPSFNWSWDPAKAEQVNP